MYSDQNHYEWLKVIYRMQLVKRAIQIIRQIVEIMSSESECCYNVLFLLQIQHQWHDCVMNNM